MKIKIELEYQTTPTSEESGMFWRVQGGYEGREQVLKRVEEALDKALPMAERGERIIITVEVW